MPEERRPFDISLKDLAAKSEDEAIAFWSTRLGQVAAIPAVVARAGAMIPITRELATLPKPQRVALIRARILAFGKLPSDQQERLNESRPVAFEHAPDVVGEELTFTEQAVLPTLPPDVAERVRGLISQAQRGPR